MGKQLCGREQPKVLCPIHGSALKSSLIYELLWYQVSNIKPILMPSFQLYIAVMSFHSLFMAINHFISCLGSEWHTCPAFSPPATIILLLFLMFEGLLFALFTSIMFGTQVSAIWHDQTVIGAIIFTIINNSV